jgi:hypothetical protein
MNLPYQAVTGFPSAGDINKAFQQNEINMTSSSLPAYQSQVVPNIINTGIGMPLWHYAVIGPDGQPGGNPALMKQGIPVYTEVYRQAFGAMPSGEKFEALLLMNDIATKLQRGFFLPKGAPDEAAADLRRAYQALASDADFVADYERITKEKPDFVGGEDVQLVFDKMRAVRPEVRQVLKLSIGG